MGAPILTAIVLSFGLSVSAAGQEKTYSPSGAITLREAAAAALVYSPQLAAFAWDVRAAEARIIQAGLRPNPEFELEAEEARWRPGPARTVTTSSFSLPPAFGFERSKEDGARSGLAETQFTLRLSQVIELGGKRMKRVALASRERDLAQWDYEAARLNVLTDVAQVFVDVVSGQERLALAEELTRLAEQVVSTVSARVEAGKVSPLESSRAEVALSSARIDQERARRELEAARARLAATWGGTSATFERAAGTLEDVSTPPAFEDLIRQIAQNPDLARWASEIARREAALRLAKAQRVPDLTLMAGVRMTGLESHSERGWSLPGDGTINGVFGSDRWEETRDNTLTFGFSLPLPVFNRNQGNIREAVMLIGKVSEERRSAVTLAHAALTGGFQELARAFAEINTLRSEVLPKAEEVFRKTQEGYRQGKFSYLDVLDAQRTLFAVRTQQLAALSAYQQARNEIERLIGSPLPEMQSELREMAPLLEKIDER